MKSVVKLFNELSNGLCLSCWCDLSIARILRGTLGWVRMGIPSSFYGRSMVTVPSVPTCDVASMTLLITGRRL